MKAVVQDRYGSPDVLRLEDIPMPVPAPGEVVVRVHAASLNARDWHVMRGEPRVARLLDRSMFAWQRPRVAVRGTDFAGTVEAVGPGVTRLRPGDEVYGESPGAFAEYVPAPAGVVAAKPKGLSFEEAAALPLAANTALCCLQAGGLGPDSHVLVNGASGGVGSFAVQLAAAAGAEVTAVCSARNADLSAALGADRVIDYAREDFVAPGAHWDLVLDLVGNRSLRELRSVLAPAGSIVLSGGGVSGQGRLVGPMRLIVHGLLTARFSDVRVVAPEAKPSTAALEEIASLVAAGSLKPVVEKTYALADAAAAVRHLEDEHARAKIVLTV